MRCQPTLVLAAALSSSFAGAGCGNGASSASGLSAYMRVAATGAQFIPGELGTEERQTAPTASPTIKNTHVFPGSTRSVTISASSTSTAVLLGLEGDGGHWLMPVGGIPDIDVEGNVLTTASASFSPDLPPSDRNLVSRAVDADGNVGPPKTLPLKITEPAAIGALVIQLDWDTEADLDLHLHIIPADGSKAFDVWAKAPLASATHTDADVKTAGHFVFDSNGRCVIDGGRSEQIVFDQTFPAGEYEVRVDTFSLCAEATARWHVQAYTNPAAVPPAMQGSPKTCLEAYGQSIDRDTVGDHTATSGLFALDLYPTDCVP